MAYNINFAEAIKVSKPDNYSKPVGFPSTSKDMGYSFRDSLKEAERYNSRNELKADDRASLRREMVDRSESKLKSSKAHDVRYEDNTKTIEENDEKQKDKLDTITEQILSKLKELTSLQQMGEIPAEKYEALLESLKEALKELEAAQLNSMGPEASSLQAKAAELRALLEVNLSELRTNGSLTAGSYIQNIAAELKAMLAERAPESENTKNSAADTNFGDASIKSEANMSDTNAANNGGIKEMTADETASLRTEINEGQQAESKHTNEAGLGSNQEMKAETAVAGNKKLNMEAQPAAEENAEDIKSALESKVEKVTVESKENQKQDSEAENRRETGAGIHKTANAVNSKVENTDMSAVKLDQTIIDSKVWTVQNQTAASRPAPVNKAEVINQIVKKAEIIFTDSQPEIRMQLEPENLGKLTLKLAVEKGLVTAKFVAESYEVKQIIESSFNELKDMLQEKGLEVQNFSVSVGQENKDYNSNSFQQWKETVRLNGRSNSRGWYEGYLEGEGTPIRTVNPYDIHNGQFDHRA